MKRLLIASPLLLFLTAATCNREPGIEVRTVTETVEVQVPCLAEEDIPERPVPLTDEERSVTDARGLLAVLTAKLLEWAGEGGYGDRADPLLRGCAGS